MPSDALILALAVMALAVTAVSVFYGLQVCARCGSVYFGRAVGNLFERAFCARCRGDLRRAGMDHLT